MTFSAVMRRCLARSLAVATLGASFSTVGIAQADSQFTANEIKIEAGAGDRHVEMGIGRSLIVDLPGDASELFVSNPQIANAVVRSARKIYLIASSSGQTSVFAMDKDGRKIAVLDIRVGRDMDELRRILAKAIPDNDIHVSTVNDTVILTGTVASAIEAQTANDIAKAFVGYTAVGGNAAGGGQGSTTISLGSAQIVSGQLVNSLVIRGGDQVMLRVTVAEVQRNIIKQLGVSPSGSWSTGSAAFDNMPAAATQPATALIPGGYVGYGLLGLHNKSHSLTSYIQAFEKDGVAHILAEPTVTAISGESAKFTVGGTVPVATQSSFSNNTCTVSSTLMPYGVTLNFTPTVLSQGRISLHLATEVTELDPISGIPSSCANILGFTTRKNETTVELPSGGSIMSAGLIQQKNNQVIAGVPGLMNLPILGTLFRSRDYQRQESELVVIVTPYIAKTLAPDQIARPDDGLVDANDPQSMFLGRVNQTYSSTPNPGAIQSFKGQVGFIQD